MRSVSGEREGEEKKRERERAAVSTTTTDRGVSARVRDEGLNEIKMLRF